MWLHQHSIVFVYSLIVSLQCYIIVLNRTFTQMWGLLSMRMMTLTQVWRLVGGRAGRKYKQGRLPSPASAKPLQPPPSCLLPSGSRGFSAPAKPRSLLDYLYRVIFPFTFLSRLKSGLFVPASRTFTKAHLA